MGVMTLEGGSVLYLLESYANGRIARRTFSACRQIAVINRKMLAIAFKRRVQWLVDTVGAFGFIVNKFPAKKW